MAPLSEKIIFVAQFYRWSKTKKATIDYQGALDDDGTQCLWSIRPDGTELTPLTDDKHDIEEPYLSADRKWICFEQTPVRHLNRFRHPDKKSAYLDGYTGPDPIPIPCKIPIVRGKIQPSRIQPYRIEDKPESDWPDDCPEIKNSKLLADGSVIGDMGQDFEGPFKVVLWKPGSKKVKTITLRALTQGSWSEGVVYTPDVRHEWYLLPGRASRFLVETYGQRSDGRCITTALVDLDAQTWKGFSLGRIIGISPTGTHAAMAASNWIGEYKNGGARCGALEIVHLATGTARAITTRLVTITGGFWI